MTGLRISDTFELPLDVATDTSAILAKKGAGKSNAAIALAEELHRVDVPFVYLDPKGDSWGIRSSADGQLPGLPVVVFGGKHGDVPLEATAGALIADLILGDDDRGYLSCVLDVSQFTYGERDRFLLAFGERLFFRKDEERVLHLIFEEAHEYLPQVVGRAQAQLVGMYQRIVKQGRFKGLGVTLVSQRSAALNKGVLTQADNLFMLRTTSPQDRAAVKAWFDEHIDAGDVIKQLPSLHNGECFLWSPERYQDPQRFTFRRRETFDSGATPKVGEKRVVPRTLADVDLGAVKDAMAETIEKAKADDPRHLRTRIAELERELAASAAEAQVVEVPVLADEDRIAIAEIGGAMAGLAMALKDVDERVSRALTSYPTEKATPTRVEAIHRGSSAPRRPRQSPGERITPGVAAEGKTRPERTETRPFAPAGASGLSKAERSVLTVLAQYGDRTKVQVAILTGYSHKGGGYNNALGSLRTAGYIEGRDTLSITPPGREALGPFEPLPTGDALVTHWTARLGKAERLILRELVAEWPNYLTKAELGERTGYVPTGGGFNNALGRLRGLELINGTTEIRASDDLAKSR